jgi:hypothetical protein
MRRGVRIVHCRWSPKRRRRFLLLERGVRVRVRENILSFYVPLLLLLLLLLLLSYVLC